MNDQVDTTPLAYATIPQLRAELERRCKTLLIAYISNDDRGERFFFFTTGSDLMGAGLLQMMNRAMDRQINVLLDRSLL